MNPIIKLQKGMDSPSGQLIMNYAYSWGASVVILGALFKLTHISGANAMLFIGMITEAVVFFISGFEKTYEKVPKTEGQEAVGGGQTVVVAGGTPLPEGAEIPDGPIVIGGGPCVYNPEPIADFFDIFYIGEGETKYRELFDLYEDCKEKKLSRHEFLRLASHIGGLYVPSLYNISYKGDGTIKAMEPIYDDVPKVVKKEVVKDLDDVSYPLKPIVPFIRAIQDRMVLEVQRGCIRGCRFCQAGQIYKPIRERSVEKLLEYADTLIEKFLLYK